MELNGLSSGPEMLLGANETPGSKVTCCGKQDKWVHFVCVRAGEGDNPAGSLAQLCTSTSQAQQENNTEK